MVKPEGYWKKYYQDHKEVRKQQEKKCYEKHREERIKWQIEYCNIHKEEISARNKLTSKERYQRRKEYYKQYKIEHKEEVKKIQHEYYLKHMEKKRKYDKEYREKHRKKLLAYLKEYNKSDKRDWNAKSAKRRGLKFIRLMINPFSNEVKIEWHHINNWFVIPLPKKIHQCSATNKPNQYRTEMANVIKELFLLDVEVFLYE